MGIFDFIELDNHIQAIGEYLLYLDGDPKRLQESGHVHDLVRDHLRSMKKILDKMKK